MATTIRSLTAHEELELGRAILAAEQDARTALEGVQELQGMLGARGKGSERTRAGAVERLRGALEVATTLGRNQPEIAARANTARESLERAHTLQWSLAMSERRIADSEARKLGGAFLDPADLVQEGYVGLLDAARRFDPARGLRFATYARWWVRARMTRAIDTTGRVIRLPGNAVEQLRNLKKAEHLTGGGASSGDLASWAGIDAERLSLLRSRGPVVSLDDTSGDGEGRPLSEVLSDDEAVAQEDHCAGLEQAERLRRAMADVLDERQQRVLVQRFGLRGDQDLSLSEIARRMNLSRERVRQIERTALRGLSERLTSLEREAPRARAASLA